MGQCDSILYNSDGKIVEQCQWGIGHDGEHVYYLPEEEPPKKGATNEN